MLTRQIEALNLLQKTRRLGPKVAAAAAPLRFGSRTPRTRSRCSLSPQVLTGPKAPGQQFRHEDEDEDGDDTAVLERKVHGAEMPEAALKVCLKELKRSGSDL